MMSTIFRNASGLPNDEQVTTARDMAILAQHLIRDFPEYYGCFQTKYFTYRGHRYRNHNHLLFGYKGTDGIKTGYTRAAGFNLTASVRRDDKHLVAVVLGGRTGSQRDAAMRSLLDRSFPKAVAGRVRPVEAAPLVASLETPAPPPPVAKKRVFALSSAGPAEPVSFSEDAPAQPLPGSLPSALRWPPPNAYRRSEIRRGAYHVQVGAFTSQAEARAGSAKSRAVRPHSSTAISRSRSPSKRTKRNGTARASPASRRMRPERLRRAEAPVARLRGDARQLGARTQSRCSQSRMRASRSSHHFPVPHPRRPPRLAGQSGIHEASVEIGGQYLRVLDGLRVDDEDVAVEDGEIGPLPNLQAAGRRVLLHGVGGIDRIGVDRRLKRNALLDIERRLSRAAGPRNGGLKGAERIVRGDVPVAAADDGGACLHAGCLRDRGNGSAQARDKAQAGLRSPARAWPIRAESRRSRRAP